MITKKNIIKESKAYEGFLVTIKTDTETYKFEVSRFVAYKVIKDLSDIKIKKVSDGPVKKNFWKRVLKLKFKS